MRLLMIEDDAVFGKALQRSLVRAGYAVDWIDNGRSVAGMVRAADYECVLVDLGLPDLPGDQIVRLIRGTQPEMPIIVITAQGALGDRLSLFRTGADDYLVKPVDLDEVSARVRALTRRLHQARGGDAVLSFGPLRLNPSRRTATWHGQFVALTNREFWLLEMLVRKKDEIVSRERIEASLYGWGDEVGSNAVEVYIHHLRKKLAPGLIRTVRGVGYQVTLPPESAS